MNPTLLTCVMLIVAVAPLVIPETPTQAPRAEPPRVLDLIPARPLPRVPPGYRIGTALTG